MVSLKSFGVLLLMFSCFASTGLAQDQKRVPHYCAHAHNDYNHPRPLQDALDHGFWSVEADIFLVEGQLLVGHSRDELSPQRTLRTLYLAPLKTYFAKHQVQTAAPSQPFMLLIDIKEDGQSVYPVLHNLLQEFKAILSAEKDDTGRRGKVQVVISGDRPWELIEADNSRLVAIDGRLSDLNAKHSAQLMTLISDRWTSHFKYRGEGTMSAAERAKLNRIVQQAHQAGRRIRFWATPETESTWQELLNAGVDHINTDRLQQLDQFLSRTLKPVP